MGILFMLIVVAGVLGAFASFFIYLIAARQGASPSTEGIGLNCSMFNLGMPLQASTHAAEIDQMTVLVHWLMLVMFVGWGLFFVFVLFRFRSGANPKASYAGAKGKISKGTEVAVAIIEVVLLVVLRDSRVGDAREGLSRRERGGRRPRRRRAVCVEHPLSRARRQIRPDRHQADHRRQSARPGSRRSPRPRTTSRRSTS